MDSIKIRNKSSVHESWKVICEREEMELEILDYHQKHFAQAEGSMPTKPPLATILGDGHNQACDAILNGTYHPPEDLNDILKQYLTIMKRENNSSTQSPHIPLEAIKDGYRKWPERTSTSPSGVHLGH